MPAGTDMQVQGVATPPPLAPYEVCGQGRSEARYSLGLGPESVRAARYRRRARAQELAAADAAARGEKRPRECACGTQVKDVRGAIEIVATEHGASLGNVAWCGSVWQCPVCSGVIRRGRQTEVREGIAAHRKAGGGLILLTLTIRHRLGHNLPDLRQVMSRAWRRLSASRKWKRLREELGVEGYVRTAELTWSEEAGWHLHWHYLVFCAADAPDDAAERMDRELTAMWAAAVAATAPGGEYTPNEHGVDAQAVVHDDAAEAYVTKALDGGTIAAEVTRGDLKLAAVGHVTPFQLLDLVGDARAVALWHEYRAATKGMRSVYWTRGLRTKLGLGEAKADDELLDEATSGKHEVIGAVADEVWDDLVRERRWRAIDRVLVLAGQREWQAIAAMLGCGLGEYLVPGTGEVVPAVMRFGPGVRPPDATPPEPPRLPERVVEETDDYIIRTTSWGVTRKNFKHATTTPENLAYEISTPDAWMKVRDRMQPSDDRIPWDNLKRNYKKWAL